MDAALHARDAGPFFISPDRALVLSWDGEALLAALPAGGMIQDFLATPTEEVERTKGTGKFRFTLDPDGRPIGVTYVVRRKNSGALFGAAPDRAVSGAACPARAW